MSHFDRTRSDFFSMYGPSYLFANNNNSPGISAMSAAGIQPTLHPAFYSLPHLPGLYRDPSLPQFYQSPGNNHVVYNAASQVSHPSLDLSHLPYDLALYGQARMNELGFTHGFGPPNLNFSSPIPPLEAKVEVRSASSLDYRFYGAHKGHVSPEGKVRKRPESALDTKSKQKKRSKSPLKGSRLAFPIPDIAKVAEAKLENVLPTPRAVEQTVRVCSEEMPSHVIKREECHPGLERDWKSVQSLYDAQRAKSCEPTASEALDLSVRPRSKTMGNSTKGELTSQPQSFSVKSDRLEQSVLAIRRFRESATTQNTKDPSVDGIPGRDEVPDDTCDSSLFMGSASSVRELEPEEDPKGTKDSVDTDGRVLEENREPFSDGGCSRTTPFAKVVFSCKQTVAKSSVFCAQQLTHTTDSSVPASNEKTWSEQKPAQPSQLLPASPVPTQRGAVNDRSEMIGDKNDGSADAVSPESTPSAVVVKIEQSSPEVLRCHKESPIPPAEEWTVVQSPLPPEHKFKVETGKQSPFSGNFFSPGHGIYPSLPKEIPKSPVPVKSEVVVKNTKEEPKELKLKSLKDESRKCGGLLPKKQGSIPVGIAVARQRTTVTTTTINNTKSKTATSFRQGNVPLAPRQVDSRPFLVQISPTTSISIQNAAVSTPAWATSVCSSADQQVGISQQSVWVGPTTAFTAGGDVTQMILPPTLPIGYQMPTGSSPLLLIPASCLDPAQRPSFIWPAYQPTWSAASPVMGFGSPQALQPTSISIQHHTSYRMVAPVQPESANQQFLGDGALKSEVVDGAVKTESCVTQAFVTEETLQTTTSVVGFMSPVCPEENLHRPTRTGSQYLRLSFEEADEGTVDKTASKYEVPDVFASDVTRGDAASLNIPPKQDAVIQTDTPVPSDDDYESEIDQLSEDEKMNLVQMGDLSQMKAVETGGKSDLNPDLLARDNAAPWEPQLGYAGEALPVASLSSDILCRTEKVVAPPQLSSEFRTLEVSDIGLTSFPSSCDREIVMKVSETRVPEVMKVQEPELQSPDLSGLKLLMESIDKVEARSQPCNGLDLLSTVAEERILERRRSDARRTTFESLCVVASTFCGSNSPAQPVTSDVFEPVTSSKIEDDVLMDSNELDMRVRMAELQRKYREKQRELHRLDERSPTRRKSTSRKLSASETRPKRLSFEKEKRRSKSVSGSEEDETVFSDLGDHQQSVISLGQASSSKKRKLGFPRKNPSKTETTETIVPKKSKIYGMVLNNNEEEWKPKVKPKFRAEVKVRTPSPEVPQESNLLINTAQPLPQLCCGHNPVATTQPLPQPSSELKPKLKSPRPAKKSQNVEAAPLPENREARAPKEGELVEKLRVLVPNENLLSAGHVTPISPPDIYGVVLDGERKNKPRIYSREDILDEALLEVKVSSPEDVPPGTRVCAFWSHCSKVLYPGRVSAPQKPLEQTKCKQWLIEIDFDDGDSGKIPLEDVRVLPEDYPVKEYNRDPLKAFERHRKRRDSSRDVTVSKATVPAFETRTGSIEDKTEKVEELCEHKVLKKKKKKDKGKKKEKRKHKRRKRSKERREKSREDSEEIGHGSGTFAIECDVYGPMPRLESEISEDITRQFDTVPKGSVSPRKSKKKRKDKDKNDSHRKRHKSEATPQLRENLLTAVDFANGVSDSPMLFRTLIAPRRNRTVSSEPSVGFSPNFFSERIIHDEAKMVEVDIATSEAIVEIRPGSPCHSNQVVEDQCSTLSPVDGDRDIASTSSPVGSTVTDSLLTLSIGSCSKADAAVNYELSSMPDNGEAIGLILESSPAGQDPQMADQPTQGDLLNEDPGSSGEFEDVDETGEAEDLEDVDDEESEEEVSIPGRLMCAWEWQGVGTKRKGKTYYKAIKRGDEVIGNGECALFYSMATSTDEDARPYIGRIVSMWSSQKGNRVTDVVKVFWLYFPEDIDKSVRPQAIPEGGLFESAHPDENLLQTIDRKVEVLPIAAYRARTAAVSEDLSDLYYSAGFYNVKTRQLVLEPKLFEES